MLVENMIMGFDLLQNKGGHERPNIQLMTSVELFFYHNRNTDTWFALESIIKEACQGGMWIFCWHSYASKNPSAEAA